MDKDKNHVAKQGIKNELTVILNLESEFFVKQPKS